MEDETHRTVFVKKVEPTIHKTKSPLAGKEVSIRECDYPTSLCGKTFIVEDWWDRVQVSEGKSWRDCHEYLVCANYKMRMTRREQNDDEVLYGRIGPFNYLVHVSDIIT
jgi:hypothetical protein